MNTDAPSNGIYIVLGEINLLLANLKRQNNKYHSNSHSNYENPSDQLSKNFLDLKSLLNEHSDLSEIDPSTIVVPFLEVIKSEETSGSVTGLALTSVDKFISYGLIGVNSETTATCVQQISDSITHARFVGSDSSSDEVVLMKILHLNRAIFNSFNFQIIKVLRTLMLSPIGFYLTNSSVCEIMQSCFQICFEHRLTELLRRTAENILVDMIQLLFARLPLFREEAKFSAVKKLTMKGEHSRQKKTKKSKTTESQNFKKENNDSVKVSKLEEDSNKIETKLSKMKFTTESSAELVENNVQKEAPIVENNNSTDEKSQFQTAHANHEELGEKIKVLINDEETTEEADNSNVLTTNNDDKELRSETTTTATISSTAEEEDSDYVNPRGVRFVQDGPNGVNVANIPYGLPCLRELLRFLISLINAKNSEIMVSMGLNLITVGLESGIDHISSYQSLMAYVKDDLCKNLYHLLSSERLSVFASVLRVSFLLFESLRGHLKLQMEHFYIKLMEIITNESNRVSYEQKEMVIDYFLQMIRIPGFAVELYLNYDCCLNFTNLFENLTKLLSKNAFSVQSFLTANSLSLSALLAIVENIEIENSFKSTKSNDSLNLLQNSVNSIRIPPSSGFISGKNFNKTMSTNNTNSTSSNNTSNYYKNLSLNSNNASLKKRFNRMKINVDNLPKQDELKSVRLKKRLINQSIDLFNTSPSKSIQFLKDNNIFSDEPTLFIDQLIRYLKETPSLDKKVIGDYLSNRKNIKILEEFVKSFNFKNLRIDEALRLFLETFRLPGEAPLISTIMEIFARHWRSSNNEKFANDDAAFTLAYAIIMLNVDQHNHNVKKQSTPMIVEEFKKNLSKVNGGGNFEDALLEEIYHAIKTEEIVMPSEHKGIVRDNYMWKVLIRRGETPDSVYTHAPTGSYNQDIFNIVWGQTISALSFVYDKSFELSVILKAINGFKKCAQVAAFYSMTDVFDNIVISLCKFTALSNPITESADQLAINFGVNNKAQLACKTVFQLTHNHGDILRDGWKNILDCIIQLYKAKLLPKVLVECEDYLNSKGRISLIKEEVNTIQKSEGSGLFSSFFPFMSSDLTSNKGPTPEEQEAIKNAQSCVDECHIEQLIHDTKFLRVDSLLELIKALIFISQTNEIDVSIVPTSTISDISNSASSNINSTITHNDNKTDLDSAIFCLEILIKVVLQNRDRITCIWNTIRNHFYNIIINSNDYSFFLERTAIGLLRITARLLRREELATEVLSLLRMLLLFKKKSIYKKLSRQISFGIHDLLRTNAANINSNDDWSTIFTILQVYGAGATSPFLLVQNYQFSRSFSFGKSSNFLETKALSNEALNSVATESSKSIDKGYTSDSELYQSADKVKNDLELTKKDTDSAYYTQSDQQSYKKDQYLEEQFNQSYTLLGNLANQYKIDLDDEGLSQHDKKAFAKCCETLTLLIRDMAHITLQNFESCVHCLRTFVEACVVGDINEENKKEQTKLQLHKPANNSKLSKLNSKNSKLNQIQNEQIAKRRSNSPTKNDSDDDDDQFITSYETISIQLLDLLDTLHIKAASVFTNWAEEQRNIIQQPILIDSVVSNLWAKCWCPILQGIARLSCDRNGEVRMHALQYLQRALLVHELQTLSALEWEACFNKVLFPLLAKLLENIDPKNQIRMEETRMRASTLLCKVFLQHLTTLAKLSTFTALWLTILDYMDKYMKSDKSDLLHDVIPESLKNMLLVMETTGLFNRNNSDLKLSQLCIITKDRIESFLPGLWEEIFKPNSKNENSNNNNSQANLSSTVENALIQNQIIENKPDVATKNDSNPIEQDNKSQEPEQLLDKTNTNLEPQNITNITENVVVEEKVVQAAAVVASKPNNDIKDI